MFFMQPAALFICSYRNTDKDPHAYGDPDSLGLIMEYEEKTVPKTYGGTQKMTSPSSGGFSLDDEGRRPF